MRFSSSPKFFNLFGTLAVECSLCKPKDSKDDASDRLWKREQEGLMCRKPEVFPSQPLAFDPFNVSCQRNRKEGFVPSTFYPPFLCHTAEVELFNVRSNSLLPGPDIRSSSLVADPAILAWGRQAATTTTNNGSWKVVHRHFRPLRSASFTGLGGTCLWFELKQ